MRCKSCRQPMRPVAKAQFPVILPILLAAAGSGGAVYLMFNKMVQMPVAAAVAVITAVGGVLLGAMTKTGYRCDSCGAVVPMSPDEERRVEAEDRQAESDRLRDQLAGKLRPQIEDDLRPQIESQLRPTLEREIRSQVEDELRPQIAEELRAQFEEELRPHLAEQLRPQIERDLEAKLRPEIERQIRSQLTPSGRIAQPMPGQPAARASGGSPAPTSRQQTSPTRSPSGQWPTQPPPQPAAPAAASSVLLSGPLSPVGSVTDPHARAQRRARVIVSDIALYHKELIAEAVRSADPKKTLDSIWEEAVRSYNEAIPDEVRRSSNYLADAFDAFIAQKRKEQNL